MIARRLCLDRSLDAALFLLYWLLIVQLPTTLPSPQLDPSWASALSYFAARSFQFGSDLIFTFGLLGYLFPNVYSGFLLADKIFFELLVKGFMAMRIVIISRKDCRYVAPLVVLHLFLLSNHS